MMRIWFVAAVALAMLACFQSGVDAGAKGGKIRWTHKKTGGGKALEPITVPAAQGNTPGKIELKVIYEGGKLAEFCLIGDGDTDLDVQIYDAAGNVVAKDIDPPAAEGGGSDICICRWTPAQTAEFRIVITNEGPVVNIAQAATN
jgi:hypothetical protein